MRSIAASADGRLGFATFSSGNGLAVIDLAGQQVVKRLSLGELARRAYTTADGRRIVVPNDGDDTISIVDATTLAEMARVPGGLVMTGVNTGWFETTAFVFARTQRQIIVIDLDQAARVGEIPLPGRPEAGVTTPDGAKLYVALGDKDSVAVIDTHKRRLAKMIEGAGDSPWGAPYGRHHQLLPLRRPVAPGREPNLTSHEMAHGLVAIGNMLGSVWRACERRADGGSSRPCQ